MDSAETEADGDSGEDDSGMAVISADGRMVVFRSSATNLDSITPDTNGVNDIYVRDRTLGTTVRASINTDGSEADADCLDPAISGDGWTVAFTSRALTLVTPNDTDPMGDDVFAHDLATGTTEKVSGSATGGESTGQSYRPSLSYDGRHVAFESSSTDLGPADGNANSDIYVYDRWTWTMEPASVNSDELQGDGASDHATISGDGRYVAFTSQATNLAAGGVFGGVYLRDRDLGTTAFVVDGRMQRFPNQ